MADSPTNNSSTDLEKTNYSVQQNWQDGKHVEGLGGDLQVYKNSRDLENLKLAKDGKTILIPQPTEDPEDPLNWSWRKKHVRLCERACRASFIFHRTDASG